VDNAQLLTQWAAFNEYPRSPWFTADNWFEYGYASHPGLFRVDDSEYQFRVGRKLTRPVLSLKAEGAAAAAAIFHRAGHRRITLLLSGGLDSHFMAECFITAGIPFTCLLIRHAGGRNSHDLTAALLFAKTHGLEYRFHDLDMDSIITDGWGTDNARLSQCWHLGYAPWCATVEAAHQPDEVLVSGFNEPEVCWEPNFYEQFASGNYHAGQWVFHDHERFPSFQKYLTATDHTHVVPSFYQFTMELWTAFITSFPIQRLVAGAYNRRVFSSDHVKHLAYELPPRIKYTGYERVLSQLFAESERMRQSLPVKCGSSINVPYRDILDTLGYQ
jgi:hypothetical protein